MLSQILPIFLWQIQRANDLIDFSRAAQESSLLDWQDYRKIALLEHLNDLGLVSL